MTVGRPLVRLDTVSSTMEVAAALAKDGATSGTAVLAAHQQAGRGRAGRQWIDAPGMSILLSFIYRTSRPIGDTGILAPLLGVAIAETIAPLVPSLVTVKWPNDVLVAGRKIAGILVSATQITSSPCLVIGMGINVNQPAGFTPEAATSLLQESGKQHEIDRLLPALFDNLTRLMESFESDAIDAWRSQLDIRLAWRDEPVRVQDGPRSIDGVVRRVGDDGALLLEQSGGITHVVAGDLTRGPRTLNDLPE